MRTIGRNLGRSRTNGDYIDTCSYCGIDWPRSRMTRDQAGMLACPDDKQGRCSALLDSLNAENAAALAAAKRRPGRNPKW